MSPNQTGGHRYVQGKLCEVEVWPGDGDSTSSRRLPSQPISCARARQADTHNPATETFYHTHLNVDVLAGTATVLCLQATVQVKGKERKSIYIALFLAKVVHSKRSGMDHTVLPANNTMPAFPEKR